MSYVVKRIFTADAVLISAGAKYLRLAGGSYLFCGISQVYLCVMKNIGHPRMSTVISSVCVVFDAFMNAVLIFGLLGLPKMNIAGAAISTADQYLFGMLIMNSVYMVRKSVNAMTIAGIFCAGGDSKFGFLCDTIVMWCITVPLGSIAAFVLKLPVIAVCCIVNADELLKLPAVYRHYKKYLWVKDLTVKENELWV